ncbi:MAG: DUF763 domain-containing protein [Candidatus Pacearchaeota archaeon]
MKNIGIVDLPLHGGNCPSWLFSLMKKLSGRIVELIVDEYGQNEFLRRISDPYWFQAFGSALGFDWHSSGLTTTTCAALKEALKENDLGLSLEIGFAGGKGKTSKKTPQEIIDIGDKMSLNEIIKQNLIYCSRLSAKVDNNLVQDGFQLYHHSFFFTKRNWAIIQQGMSEDLKLARRYHWISENLSSFVNEPHKAIVCNKIVKTFNLTAKEVENTRETSLNIVKENPNYLKKYFKVKNLKYQTTLTNFEKLKSFKMSNEHFPKIDFNLKTMIEAYEKQPQSYEELVLIKGMGAKNLRALAMISHLVYGTTISWKDPVKFAFTHGGKDGWPEPVDQKRYNESIDFLKSTIKDAKLGKKDKVYLLKRLDRTYKNINL